MYLSVHSQFGPMTELVLKFKKNEIVNFHLQRFTLAKAQFNPWVESKPKHLRPKKKIQQATKYL